MPEVMQVGGVGVAEKQNCSELRRKWSVEEQKVSRSFAVK